MDKSPKPMKNYKPVKTVDNAADQFRKTHEDPYEYRAKPSRDRMRAVITHNKACPKLQDELEKRRSISRVTTDEASRGFPKTGACRKRMSCDRPKNNTYSRRKAKATSKSNKRAAVVKKTHKRPIKKRRHPKSMIGTCPRCLTVISGKRIPFRIKRSIENIFIAKKFDKSQSDEDATPLRVAKKDGKPKEDNISIASTTYPDTSDQTFASYHSFASMDKEPMVD